MVEPWGELYQPAWWNANVLGDKEVKYVTHLSDDRTRTLHRAIDQGKFKEYIAGLTLMPYIDIPDVSKPDSLQVGDEITRR